MFRRRVEICGHPGLFTSTPFGHLPPALDLLGWESTVSQDGRRWPTAPLISFNGAGLGRRSTERPVRVLILLEPDVTLPGRYEFVRRADAAFAASVLWGEQLQVAHFPWPQDLSTCSVSHSSQPFAATLVAADKRSASRQALYGLRRQTLRLAGEQGVPIAVVGAGWQAPPLTRMREGFRQVVRRVRWRRSISLREAFGDLRFEPPNYLGPFATKGEAYAFGKSTIVIENSADYVSEKLIDAVRHETVPIYVGPSLSAFGIPSDVAVCVDPSPHGIVDAVSRLHEERYEQVIEAGRDWLASPESRRQLGRNVVRNLARSIVSVLEQEQLSGQRERHNRNGSFPLD